ncbi:ATP-binding cassette sub- G member 2 [Boothiomyces sp. JEL0838]|nr:ATP-binding cassette sub- G member 2 [Boothiomyces sp. JEL0838]
MQKKDDFEPTESFAFSWSNVSFTISNGKESKQVLHNMSGKVHSGQVLGIMGGSGMGILMLGAGKSTLLNVLAGRIGAGELTGDILFKDRPRNLVSWKTDCAYVEQADLMFPNLTVQETLDYSARFRLPHYLPKAEKDERVNEIIMDLGLNNCRNTVIGDENVRGISGGERKRVSIGVEIVTTPDIIFLDEPTSGLDSFNAFNLVEMVKKLAVKQNKIVVMTVHQPRTDIIELFDNILLLSAGETLWLGPTTEALEHFEKLGFSIPPNTNPSDFFLDITTLDQRSEELKKRSEERILQFKKEWEIKSADRFNQTKLLKDIDDCEEEVNRSSWINDFLSLFGRSAKMVVRDKPAFIAKVAQTVIMLIMLGTLFWQSPMDAGGIQNRVGVLFFLCINLSFATVMPIIATLPKERAVIRRERSAGAYSSSAAFLASFITYIPSAVFVCFLLTVPMYWMIGFQNSMEKYGIYLLIGLSHTITSVSIGILVASAIPSIQVGQIVGPLVITVFMLFGGPILNLDSASPAFKWMQYISVISYSNKAYVQNEFIGAKIDCSDPKKICYKDGQMIVDTFALGNPKIMADIWCNILLCAGFALIAGFVFERTSRPIIRLE